MLTVREATCFCWVFRSRSTSYCQRPIWTTQWSWLAVTLCSVHPPYFWPHPKLLPQVSPLYYAILAPVPVQFKKIILLKGSACSLLSASSHATGRSVFPMTRVKKAAMVIQWTLVWFRGKITGSGGSVFDRLWDLQHIIAFSLIKFICKTRLINLTRLV